MGKAEIVTISLLSNDFKNFIEFLTIQLTFLKDQLKEPLNLRALFLELGTMPLHDSENFIDLLIRRHTSSLLRGSIFRRQSPGVS